MNRAATSRPVSSSQAGVHPRLAGLLDAHLRHAWLQPLHGPTIRAFRALQDSGRIDGRPLVLDSGCGTGAGTLEMGREHPDCLVIGVDKSAARLATLGSGDFPRFEGNVAWLRAELSSFWRLALEAGWRLERHYLLYPNPWPKPGQLQRRWHAHPVFPQMLGLGGRLEMRCNWGIYAEEFAFALNRVLATDVAPGPLAESGFSTPFERKYRASGHRLYSVVVDCA